MNDFLNYKNISDVQPAKEHLIGHVDIRIFQVIDVN